ncbi:MAG: class B sortase [Romboutsia sp.]
MKKLFRNFINIILILVLCFSLYQIFLKSVDYKKASDIHEEILVEKEENYNNLVDINPDFKFWIEVENTNINYPVLQSYNNKFYLNRDIYKNYLSSGSIFMDYRNDFEKDSNIIIYGHNMKNKTMFENLEKFKEKDFFYDDNKIKIITSDKEYVYEVFSVYFIDASYDYLVPRFDTDEDFEKYLDEVKKRSIFESDVKISSSDKIITLSTCSYEGKNTRTVINGKLNEL